MFDSLGLLLAAVVWWLGVISLACLLGIVGMLAFMCARDRLLGDPPDEWSQTLDEIRDLPSVGARR